MDIVESNGTDIWNVYLWKWRLEFNPYTPGVSIVLSGNVPNAPMYTYQIYLSFGKRVRNGENSYSTVTVAMKREGWYECMAVLCMDSDDNKSNQPSFRSSQVCLKQVHVSTLFAHDTTNAATRALLLLYILSLYIHDAHACIIWWLRA